jgi:hypothetical protein
VESKPDARLIHIRFGILTNKRRIYPTVNVVWKIPRACV